MQEKTFRGLRTGKAKSTVPPRLSSHSVVRDASLKPGSVEVWESRGNIPAPTAAGVRDGGGEEGVRHVNRTINAQDSRGSGLT